MSSGFGTQGLPHGTLLGVVQGSYLRPIYSSISQLKAQGPFRTCYESKEERKEEVHESRLHASRVSLLDLEETLSCPNPRPEGATSPRVQDLSFVSEVEVLGLENEGSGAKVQGSWCRVWGSGVRVHG